MFLDPDKIFTYIIITITLRFYSLFSSLQDYSQCRYSMPVTNIRLISDSIATQRLIRVQCTIIIYTRHVAYCAPDNFENAWIRGAR